MMMLLFPREKKKEEREYAMPCPPVAATGGPVAFYETLYPMTLFRHHSTCAFQHSSWNPKELHTKDLHKVDWDNLDHTKFFLWGSSLFFFVRVFMHPSVVVKTKMQIQTKEGGSIYYRNTSEAFSRIVQVEGLRGLWKGFSPTLISLCLRQWYFSMYETSRAYIKRVNDKNGYIPDEHLGLVRDALSGLAATVIYQSVCNPIDVVVQKMMVSSERSPKAIAIAREVLLKGGYMGFYRGLLPSIVQYAPSGALWWGSYGVLRDVVNNWAGDTLTTPAQKFMMYQGVCGLGAGIITVVLTNPLDVCRTRYMVLKDSGSMRQVFVNLIQEDGAKGLFKGSVARSISFGPASVLIMSIYEFVKQKSYIDAET
jgi:hypothetical protein